MRTTRCFTPVVFANMACSLRVGEHRQEKEEGWGERKGRKGEEEEGYRK